MPTTEKDWRYLPHQCLCWHFADDHDDDDKCTICDCRRFEKPPAHQIRHWIRLSDSRAKKAKTLMENENKTPDVTAPNEAELETFSSNDETLRDLLPCAFCNGAPQSGWSSTPDGGVDMDRWEIACSSCGVAMVTDGAFTDNYPHDIIAAGRQRWNTRAPMADEQFAQAVSALQSTIFDQSQRIAVLEAQAAWVDVNDRLPEVEDEYEVTIQTTIGIKPFTKYVTFVPAQTFDDDHTAWWVTSDGTVTAWRSKIAPYAPKEANEKIMDPAKA